MVDHSANDFRFTARHANVIVINWIQYCRQNRWSKEHQVGGKVQQQFGICALPEKNTSFDDHKQDATQQSSCKADKL